MKKFWHGCIAVRTVTPTWGCQEFSLTCDSSSSLHGLPLLSPQRNVPMLCETMHYVFSLCAYVCSHIHVCGDVGQRSLANQATLAGQWVAGMQEAPSPQLLAHKWVHYAPFFTEVLGTEHKSSGLHSKYFMKWAISPVISIQFSAYFAVLRRRGLSLGTHECGVSSLPLHPTDLV